MQTIVVGLGTMTAVQVRRLGELLGTFLFDSEKKLVKKIIFENDINIEEIAREAL